MNMSSVEPSQLLDVARTSRRLELFRARRHDHSFGGHVTSRSGRPLPRQFLLKSRLRITVTATDRISCARTMYDATCVPSHGTKPPHRGNITRAWRCWRAPRHQWRRRQQRGSPAVHPSSAAGGEYRGAVGLGRSRGPWGVRSCSGSGREIRSLAAVVIFCDARRDGGVEAILRADRAH